MTTETTKRHVKSGLTWSVLTLLVGSGFFGVIWDKALKPSFVTAVADEATEKAAVVLEKQVSEAVTRGIRPIQTKVEEVDKQVKAGNTGLKVIIDSNIAMIERNIDRLKYIRDFPPEGDWTNELRQELFEAQERLAAQRAALSAITEAEE